MKIITILGARPQFVKAAVVSRALQQHPQIAEIIVHTGQHFDYAMSDVFFAEMKIPKPKYNLNINGLTHGAMTGKMIEEIEKVLMQERPEWVLVYGDTNSTLAGALAAKKLHINVAHVEAGLRSFNMAMPEEINRILTDRISDLLFCPSSAAISNLEREGFAHIKCKYTNVGDVMYDAALFYRTMVKSDFPLNLPPKFVLCTVHRAENTDVPERLLSLFDGLERCSTFMPVVLPLHPRTKAKLEAFGFDTTRSSIRFIDPVGYLEMIYLLERSTIVMTDSGGLQKEAYFFNKNCITLRDETEWVELVQYGFNVLTGVKSDLILDAFNKVLTQPPPGTNGIYGSGNAGSLIAAELLSY